MEIDLTLTELRYLAEQVVHRYPDGSEPMVVRELGAKLERFIETEEVAQGLFVPIPWDRQRAAAETYGALAGCF